MAHESDAKGFPNDQNTNQPIGNVALYTVNSENQIQLISPLNPLCITRIKESKSTAVLSGPIPVTEHASIKIADANPDRQFFSVYTDADDLAVWIKLQPANADNDKKGILIETKPGTQNFWQMPSDNIYSGEISAIANFANVNLFTTEY